MGRRGTKRLDAFLRKNREQLSSVADTVTEGNSSLPTSSWERGATGARERRTRRKRLQK